MKYFSNFSISYQIGMFSITRRSYQIGMFSITRRLVSRLLRAFQMLVSPTSNLHGRKHNEAIGFVARNMKGRPA